jgi:hypothetical protein
VIKLSHALVRPVQRALTIIHLPRLDSRRSGRRATSLRRMPVLFDPERASRRGADLAANVAQAEALLRTSGLAGREQLEAFCRPATKAEIGLCLAALVAAFPDGLRADDDSYVCALEPEIWGLQPSLGAINAGCRKIKIEFKPQWGRRVPTVSEVVAAVQKAGALFECARSAHSELPERIAVAKRTLAARDIKEQRAR